MLSIRYVKDKIFWDIDSNIDLLAVPSFKKFYEQQGAEFSSKIMWAIYFIWDINSKFQNLEEAKRIKFIEIQWLENEGFFKKVATNASNVNYKLIKQVIEDYKSLQDNCIKRNMHTIAKKIDERSKFLDNTPYDLESVKKLDDAMLATSKLIKELKVLEDLVKIEENQIRTKKGGELSLMAKGAFKDV
jgi:hypothetical protein